MRIFRIASAATGVLSALLCVATLALWTRSFWRIDRVNIFVARSSGFVMSDSGRLHFYLTPQLPYDRKQHYRVKWVVLPLKPGGRLFAEEPQFPRLGLGAGSYTAEVTWHEKSVDWREYWLCAPHWMLALLASVLPIAWLSRRVRNRKLPFYCPVCGYDLQATPDRCPECGTVQTK